MLFWVKKQNDETWTSIFFDRLLFLNQKYAFSIALLIKWKCYKFDRNKWKSVAALHMK